MATYHEKKKLWEARRRITDPAGSKSRQSFWAKTETEAEELADAFVGIQPKGPVDVTTFAGFAINVYLPTVQHLSYKWRSQIKQILDNHAFPKWGNTPLKEISRHELQLWLNAKGKKLSRSQVGHIRKVTGAVLGLAETDGAIAANPMRSVRLTGKPPAPKDVYTPHEMAALFYAAYGTVMQGPILMAGFLGMRKGEVCGLYDSLVTPKSVEVRRQAQTQNGRPVLIENAKTKAGMRIIPVPEGFYSYYAQVLKTPSEFACPNYLGMMLSPENMTRELRAVCKRAKVRYLPFHRLRASFVSALEDIGCPRGHIREIVGHSAANVTDLYVEASDDIKRMFLGMLLSALETSVYETVRPLGGRIKSQNVESKG